MKGKVFNVCTGVPININQLADTLKEILGKNLKVKHGPARAGDIRGSYGDPAKAAENLGFRAAVDLKKGLQMLFEEFKK